MQLNNQPIEKRVLSEDGSLQVHSIFPTIQGEGPFTGQRAIFIRLTGCNLQCPGCDTEYTKSRVELSVGAIVERIDELTAYSRGTRQAWLVVITGGEPFRQNIEPLVRVLLDEHYRVQIETNGTLPPPPNFYELCAVDLACRDGCFVICSPKTGQVHKEMQPCICAYKYVLGQGAMNLADGLPMSALRHKAVPYLARPHQGYRGPVYLQPCDAQDEKINALNLQACIYSCTRHGYTLQLQLHKLINME